MELISGFSKLNKKEKIDALVNRHFNGDVSASNLFENYWHENPKEQEVFDQFSENTVSNFYFPYGVVPNFILNDKTYTLPMVIEESSVVAACAKASKFWAGRGGFRSRVISTTKVGQVHFDFSGDKTKLFDIFEKNKKQLIRSCAHLSKNMEKRGGGITDLELIDKTDVLENYYQIFVKFETCDAMGANFINSILEHLALEFKSLIDVEIVMSI